MYEYGIDYSSIRVYTEKCILCDTRIPTKAFYHIIYSGNSICTVICSSCHPIGSNAIAREINKSSIIKSLVNIYNNTFSDSMDIEEYLKLALGRVP